MRQLYRRLLRVTLLLALCVVTLGAYVRLSDAGLGCPDWPGCYGHFVGVPDQAHELHAAQQAYPQTPVEAPKAWKEMIHRYAAGALGLLIAALAVLAWHLRTLRHMWLEVLLVGLVIVQALLGMWTVTRLLKPVIVTLHLVGGMSILALLVSLWMRECSLQRFVSASRALAGNAWGVVAVIGVQIALGGWVSSNYAAMVCTALPSCNGEWWPAMDWLSAFTWDRELGRTITGEGLSLEALRAIHWAHRLFAVGVALAVMVFARKLYRISNLQFEARLLLLAVAVQWALGLSNVWLQWPLALAVLHNTGAALLLSVAVAIATRLSLARHR